MSYILEALKKSKEERQDEKVPHLHIVHGVPVYESRLKMSSRSGVLLAGIVVVFVVGGFLLLNQQEEGFKQTSMHNQRIRVGQIEMRDEFFEQQEDDVVIQNSSVVSSVLPDPEIVRIVRTHSKKDLPASVTDSPSGSKGQYQGIQFRSDLSHDIQKDLPEFVLAGHTYADDPRQRIIIINNTILREGDSINGDTKLLNIIWEGVVLEHRGIVFKQRVK